MKYMARLLAGREARQHTPASFSESYHSVSAGVKRRRRTRPTLNPKLKNLRRRELFGSPGHYTYEFMISDESLMQQFQGGSREAFDELFARYRQPLYGFFRRRLSSGAQAEELMQEAFLAVIRAQFRYEPKALVRTYLYGIALKLLAAERRRGARREAGLPEGASRHDAEATFWVREALQKLEEMDREVLMLREYEELSYAEIAQVLRLPLNTVRSRLFRARMALKELLAPEQRAGDVRI